MYIFYLRLTRLTLVNPLLFSNKQHIEFVHPNLLPGSNAVVYVSRYRAVVCALVKPWRKKKYLTEEELVNILYNDDSGDELIPELEDSQSESEDELPLSEIDTPIPRDVNHPSYFTIKSY
ncbi:hypothetical protein L9F63_021698 [Diploptera punctata]|uniref:Uncharacterized protein n=1 Tax=Diploptera punctata TaxID=6984 RepID=A0AAD7ZNU0_DIPPU|nr:hypothetical protein L9F63_021698 [Diploptera punctata]